jgi:dihydroorotate dehydrogenase
MFKLVRPLLFLLPPEAAHRAGMAAIRLGASLLPPPAWNPKLGRTILGIRFPSPVGLAAGFDKHAEAVPHWIKLGFGFCEIGTFTRHPQKGNARPRVWRYPAAQALINRFGFNNPGAGAAAARLSALKASGRWPAHPVGINLGKSKVTPEAEAAEDYLYSLEKLQPFADYVAVNISSPNTPGLRNLQAKGLVKKLVAALAKKARKPLFIKFAPDMETKALLASCEAALGAGAKGLILTNTTLGREGLGEGPHPEGGMSGAPLTAKSGAALAAVAKMTRGRVPLIGVGGIMRPEDAARKLDLGAWLVQLYTGFIYRGPGFASEIAEYLSTKRP